MSDTDDPLFPPDWEWQRYEDATRELAAQRVVYEHQRGQISAEEGQILLERMSIWHLEQCAAGRLPSRHARREKGEELQAIWQRLIRATRKVYTDGNLSRGRGHESADLHWRFPASEPRIARTRGPGRSRGARR